MTALIGKNTLALQLFRRKESQTLTGFDDAFDVKLPVFIFLFYQHKRATNWHFSQARLFTARKHLLCAREHCPG